MGRERWSERETRAERDRRTDTLVEWMNRGVKYHKLKPWKYELNPNWWIAVRWLTLAIFSHIYFYTLSAWTATHLLHFRLVWDETNLYPYRGPRCLQVLLSFGHQDGFVTGEYRAVAVCGRVSFPSHDSSCFHGYGHRLGAVQTVGGVIEGLAGTQSQTEAFTCPHPTMRVASLMVSILGGLGAALGCDGDEGFGGGAWWDGGRGLLVVGRVGDSWKSQKDIMEMRSKWHSA